MLLLASVLLIALLVWLVDSYTSVSPVVKIILTVGFFVGVILTYDAVGLLG